MGSIPGQVRVKDSPLLWDPTMVRGVKDPPPLWDLAMTVGRKWLIFHTGDREGREVGAGVERGGRVTLSAEVRRSILAVEQH